MTAVQILAMALALSADALGVAISFDALGAGVSMAFVGVRIWAPALVIGLVTAPVCIAGVQMGGRIGTRIGKEADLAGGVILIIVGMTFLF